MSDKLTVADLRNVEAAYERGERAVLEKLGDGPIRLRQGGGTELHDRLERDLGVWLRARCSFRGPGVCDNLFALSGHLSRGAPITKENLTFLHAYIFALEHRAYYDGKEIEELKEKVARLERLERLLTKPAKQAKSQGRRSPDATAAAGPRPTARTP